MQAGRGNVRVAGWSRRGTGAPLARLVALMSYTWPIVVMFAPAGGGAVSGAILTASLSLVAGATPTARLPSDEVALPFALKDETAVAVCTVVNAIDGLSRTTSYWYWLPGSRAASMY